MKNNINKKHQKGLSVTVLICIVLIMVIVNCYEYKNNKLERSDTSIATMENTTNPASSFIYLSDIPYEKDKSSVGWGVLTLDANLENSYNNGLITLIVNGKAKSFLKGISAHATSTVIYNIDGYNYDYFSTYFGVDASRQNNGNGVKFAIETSKDGESWDVHTPISPEVKKGTSEADYIEVDIKDKKYIRLRCVDLGNQNSDHCAYGNAKLYKEGYVENNNTVDFIKTVEEYDTLLSNTSLENQLKENELTILQRNLVKKVGYDLLQAVANYNESYKEALKYLITNKENLKLFTTGGEPDGSYINAIRVWCELYSKYKDDFENTTVTKFGNKLGNVYKKLAMSAALVYSSPVALWVQTNQPENQSNALEKYRIVKEMYANDKFVVSQRQDHTPWFESLHIEEMRFVINSPLDDEEIMWLYDYTQKQIDAHPNKEEEYLQPHHYMKYIWPNFTKPEYHDVNNKLMYNEKYGNFLDYGVTFRPGLQKLWMVLDNGAVCGGISKIGSNIRSVHGTPSSVISQPGHAAIIYYRKNANGDGYWTIDNDVFGWAQSGRTERLNLRMPNGFGNEEYIDFNKDWLGMATYVLIAQGALNDFENYEASEETLLLADLYSNDIDKLLKIYRQAVTEQPLNIDGWYGLIKTYKKDSTKTEKDFYDLAEEIMEKLKYYPLPMYHLIREIEPKLTSPEYQFKFLLERGKVLTEGKNATNDVTIQKQAVNQMASRLLGEIDNTLATFSFDGETAESIVLGNRFNDTGVRWDYSIDGKQTWKEVSFTADEAHVWKLSKEEINKITEDQDIYIHIIGVGYEEENLYKIDITKGVISESTLFGNDLENRVIGVNTSYEWRRNESDEWTSYNVASPDNTGNKKLQVRMGATGTKLPSNVLEFTFTEDNQPLTRKYVSVSHLSIDSVSTEATNNGGHAKNAIDGNYNTRYHSAWNGTDTERFITIKLDKARFISAVEFVPAGGGNGKIYDGTVYGSLDGTNWEVLATSKNWTYSNQANNNKDAIANTKSFEINNPKEVLYIKIVANRTNGNWFTAREFNIFQDLTKNPRPTAGIGYSTTTPTNKEVIARLINPSTNIKITNNGGSDTYTFKENGEFTFEFEDEFGIKGTSTAKVDWIDKVSPTATIEYSTTNITNGEVLARLIPDEEVTVLNNGTLNVENPNNDPFVYTFKENGEFTFEFMDKAGNKGSATASVNWIDKKEMEATLTYSTTSLTNQDVVVTITFNKENIKILNNNGSNTYTFTKNGEFTFEYVDATGVKKKTTAIVNWINKEAPKATIEYSITSKTKGPVTATLHSAEKIKITNNNGQSIYTFKENGSFEFIYEDEFGNVGRVTATVDWIIKDSTVSPEEPTKPVYPTNPTNPTKPKDPNNQTTITTPNDPIIENPIIKDYLVKDILVTLNIANLDKNMTLKKQDLPISTTQIKKFGQQSESFELYFNNESLERVNVDNEKVTIYINLNKQKKFLGIYKINGDDFEQLSYEKVADNQIKIETTGLTKYIVVYEDKKEEIVPPVINNDTNINNNSQTKKTNFSLLWVAIGSGGFALLICLAIIVLIKNKETKTQNQYVYTDKNFITNS